MKRAFAIFTIIVSLISCTQKRTIPESLIGVKTVVASIDSAITAMGVWEPKDTIGNMPFSMSLDELNAAHEQAKLTWTEFKGLCDSEKYEEAFNLYNAYNSELKQPNSGDFLLYLKHSQYRYMFFSEVLHPMLIEFKGEPDATEEYIEILQLEKAMEDLTKKKNDDGSYYVPEVYPVVLMDLGLALATTGLIDEARELFYDIIISVYAITGNNLQAHFVASQYAARLYLIEGQKENAIANWNLFKNALEMDRGSYDEDELEQYLKKIDDEIRQIKA